MMLKVAVCDDDNKDLELGTTLIRSIFQEKQMECDVKSFPTPQEMLESDIKSYHMVFLDIELNDMSGIDLAKRVLEENKECLVFFITNYSIYLDNAFDVNAFRYLYKPIDKTRLCAGIDRAIEKMRDASLTIRVTDYESKMTIDLEISSIIFIETYKRRTRVVSTTRDFIADEQFYLMKNRIETEAEYFVSPHQSFLVNMRFVTSYDKHDAILTCGTKNYKVDISRRGYSDFSKKMFLMAGELK